MADEPADTPDDAEALLADAVKDDGKPQGDDFNAERAKEQVAKANKEAAKYRARLKELEPLAARAQELEDASKSEAEKLTERLTAAEKRAAAAETSALRLEIAGEKGLTPAQAKRLIGATREELEADADDLLATFAPAAPVPPKPGSRPKENLKTVPVATNGATEKTDMNEWMRQQATRQST